MNQIEIKFSKNEAIILFEFLTRFCEENKLQIEDETEAIVLWNLQCELEKNLIEPFREDYNEIVKEARNSLKSKE